jgi:hypothetical protein
MSKKMRLIRNFRASEIKLSIRAILKKSETNAKLTRLEDVKIPETLIIINQIDVD